MQRFIMDRLVSWKDKENRKPLTLFGVRQSGKTWLMKEFGKTHFAKTAYISFYRNDTARDIFEHNFNIERIIMALSVAADIDITPGDTLIILDEIQDAPRAVEALKYFCEEAPEYAVIAAGSLLGVALHEGISFPVGKVDMLNIYPLSFREFLVAMDESRLAELLAANDYSIIDTFHDEYIFWLKQYYYVGGMPEVVQTFVDNMDYNEVRDIQNELLSFYSNDFSKHAPANIAERIQMVWSALPKQLSKENKKFIYGLIREGARAKEYEVAIQWLVGIGLVRKCYRISKPYIPLKSYIELENFKLYMFDIGLLSAASDLDVHTIIEGNKIFVDFKGALTEQFVAGELTAKELPLYYYSTPNSSGEIDFVLQKNSSVLPIEVKAEENLKAKSLRAFRDKYTPELSIRTSLSNYKEQDWMINVPLYMIGEYFN